MFIKISRIKLNNMRDELHSEYHKSVIYMLDKLSTEVVNILQLIMVLSDYREAFATEITVLDMVMSSKFSKPIAEKDHERDRMFKGLLSAVRTMFYHAEKEVQDAAHRIMKVLKHYGDVTKKNYEAETAAIRDLIRELDEPDNAKDMQTIKAVYWRNFLEALNNAFESLLHMRYEEKAARPAIRMKEARKETDRCFRYMVEYMEALQTVGRATPELYAFVTKLNVITKSYQDVLARTKHRSVSTLAPSPEPKRF